MANEDVFRHRQMLVGSGMLIDGRNAQLSCDERVSNLPLFSIYKNLSLLWLMDAGNHFNQGGFPRAIFS